MLQDHLGAYKHAEFGLGTATMQAQRYGYTQMINNAILTNSSYKLRFAQDLTLYLARSRSISAQRSISLPARSTGWRIRSGRARARPSRRSWARPIISNNTSRSIVVFEPLVGELFRSGFVMQLAAAQNDFMTPTVVSAAEGDYERNLANAVELFHMLAHEPEFAAHNRGRVQRLAGQAWRAGARGGERPAADLVASAGEGVAVLPTR